MITIIDNIQYLPTKNETILDTNYAKNITIKNRVDEIREKAKLINTNDKNVIVNIIGKFTTDSKFNWKIDVKCDDTQISEFVRKELSLQ